MNLEHARSGRLAALASREADRILVEPARHKSDVALPEDGTLAAYLIDALGRGSSVDDIRIDTGWSRSSVMINLYKVAKKCGVGIERRGDILHLLVPQGAGNVFPRKEICDLQTSGSDPVKKITPSTVEVRAH